MSRIDNLKIPFRILISTVKMAFRFFGVGITSYSSLADLREYARIGESLKETLDERTKSDLDFLRGLDLHHYERTVAMFDKSKSQLRQDLFVLSELNYKRGGFFVEFGATNGIDLSNTHLLSTEFAWRGILAEPAVVWHEKLLVNRPDATIETSCVWKDSDSNLAFNETADPELSTIESFSENDHQGISRRNGLVYSVNSISLRDLLVKHNAPSHIDYLSIDTEGSEFEILNAFDFDEYSFGVISVEHNYRPQRELIFQLLDRNGYSRKNKHISFWDDWYVRTSF
jgi:FkbM family methyltransferase